MEIEEFAAKIISLGGSRWNKNNMDRIYIDPRKLSGFAPSHWAGADFAAANNAKYFYDLNSDGAFEPTELQVKAGANQSRAPYWACEEIEAFINAQISK